MIRETIVDGDDLIIHDAQDVEPVLDSIARDRELMRNDGRVGRLEGRLPAIIVEDLIRREIYYDPDAFNRWWRSNEANSWRIWGGRV